MAVDSLKQINSKLRQLSFTPSVESGRIRKLLNRLDSVSQILVVLHHLLWVLELLELDVVQIIGQEVLLLTKRSPQFSLLEHLLLQLSIDALRLPLHAQNAGVLDAVQVAEVVLHRIMNCWPPNVPGLLCYGVERVFDLVA